MNNFFNYLFLRLLKILIKLRYDIQLKGLRELSDIQGALFLAPLTTELDPFLLFISLFPKIITKPLIASGMYNLHWLKEIYTCLGALFIPSYGGGKDRRHYQRLRERIGFLRENLAQGEKYLFFPAGELELSPLDLITNNVTANLLEEPVKFSIILVRIEGMWGSAFSHRLLGVDYHPIKTPLFCFFTLLKNGFFFLPKRKVVIEFQKAPADFPMEGGREAINNYLHLYFHPTIKSPVLVPPFFWQKEGKLKPRLHKTEITLNDVSEETQEEVMKEIAKLAKKPLSEIAPSQNLFLDVGLNSLDITELLIFLEENFGKKGDFEHLRTVEDVILFAAGKVVRASIRSEVKQNALIWAEDKVPRQLGIPQAETIVEAFLKICERQGSSLSMADISFISSYDRLKSMIVGLAKELQKLPGKYIGVLIPSSQVFNLLVLALMLAKKIPVLLNWTLGNKYLEEAVDKAEIETILTMEFYLSMIAYPLSEMIEKRLVTYEEIRDKITFHEKRKGLKLSKLSGDKILRHFSYKDVKKEETAVLLFTSGSEKSPKAVPLSHQNLLENQKAAMSMLDPKKEDVFFGMLPAFHVFGFSITNLLPLLYGIRAVYYHNPLDMNTNLDLIQRWQVTILCTTPTFLQGLLALGDREKLASVRLFIVGAEKAPPELFAKVKELLPHAQVIEGYGITECSPVITLNRPNTPPHGVGYPLPNVSLAIVDPETKKHLPAGKEGLILVHGPSVFSGYLGEEKDPFLYLAEKKWYITGDLGYLTPGGALFLTGRLSRTAKIGGEMISLPAMEDALEKELKKEQRENPLKLAVLAKENEKKEIKLYLYCNYPISLEKANETLKQAGFSNLFRLEGVSIVDPFPLFATGKINYQALEGK